MSSSQPSGPEGTTTSYRTELTQGEDQITYGEWAGGIPPRHAIAPRFRVGSDRWFNILWLLPIGFVLALLGVVLAQWLRTLPAVQDFIAAYPGTMLTPEAEADAGIPWWVNLRDCVIILFMMFIILS